MIQNKTAKILHTVDYIIQGIFEKKGIKVVKLDMSSIENAVAKYFVVCQGTSRTHIEAIARSVLETVNEKKGETPFHKEGFKNAEWILIDYGDVVVHIFQESIRQFYKLEELWADADIEWFDGDDETILKL